jgi:hypothetical protein
MSEMAGRQMGSGGKQPIDQLLASGAAHLRCYVRRRKRGRECSRQGR